MAEPAEQAEAPAEEAQNSTDTEAPIVEASGEADGETDADADDEADADGRRG